MPDPTSREQPSAISVVLRDESLVGPRGTERRIVLDSPRTTVAELIALQVHRAEPDGGVDDKVRPDHLPASLQRALEKFQNGQLVILVNERQIQRLDEALFLRDGCVIAFLHMGG
ncbi:hypothetical protein ACN2XU_04150 [Primorskyibacter sp. 2E107]|uniref:hypothetical protein n=1 Tax=Primorskyibacter sp. 2E107 TaxID=3403458 RepID=UPI003AF4B4E5